MTDDSKELTPITVRLPRELYLRIQAEGLRRRREGQVEPPALTRIVIEALHRHLSEIEARILARDSK